MKLKGREQRGVKRGKASELLQREQESQGFFDYERDVPAAIRREFEQSLVENRSRHLLPLSTVLHRPDLLHAMAELVPNKDLQEYFFNELESEETEIADSEAPQGFLSKCYMAENRFDFILFFKKELHPLYKERLRYDFAWKLSPEMVVEYDDDPDDALRKLFVGYKFFPEHRAAYQKIAEERFNQFLEYCRGKLDSVASWPAAAHNLKKMWFLCPRFRPQMEEFAQEMRRQFLSTVTTETQPSDYAPLIFILTLIAKYEAEITPEGQYVFRPRAGDMSQSQPLPHRSHV